MKSFTALDTKEVDRIRDALDGGMSPEDIQVEYALMVMDACEEYLDYKMRQRKFEIALCDLLVSLTEFDDPKDKLAFIEALSADEEMRNEVNFGVRGLEWLYYRIQGLYRKHLDK